MRTTIVDPLDPALRDWFADHPRSSLFSSPPWMAALTQTYGLDIRAVVAAGNGSADAALPFCHVADIRGERIVCLPFSDYCDPLLETPAAWAALSAPVLARGVPVTLRCLGNQIPCDDERFVRSDDARWHGVDLAGDEDALWTRLGGSARQNVRRARRAGVRVRVGRDLEDVRIFHRMHRHVRKSKYRLLAQPLAFFESLHACFAADDRLIVLLAEVDGTPVAGILFLVWRDTLYYKFNASTEQAVRPNDLLVVEGLRLGRELGLARLDFGLSDTAQPGLIRFKRKFATDERPIHTLRWRLPGHADRRGEEAGRTLARMSRLLTAPDVPDAVTAAAGDELYRYFC